MTTTPTRALDARLHELLGHKAVYIASVPSVNIFGEGPLGVTSNFGGAVLTAQRDWLVDDWLDPDTNDEVPHYTASPAAIRAAEQSLPVALQKEYASELERQLGKPVSIEGDYGWDDCECAANYDALYALITATPQQRATALLAVLGRAKVGEVAG